MSSVRSTRARDLIPFVGVAFAGLFIAVVPGVPDNGTAWLIAVALTLVAAPLALWDGPRRTRGLLAIVPVLAYLASVGFLRDSVGGSTGGVGVLVLLPVVWVALHGTGRQLAGTIAGAAGTWAVPLIVIGAPRYPATGWRGCVLLVLLSVVLGTAIQRLVMRIRSEAAERAELAQRLERVAGTDHLTALPNRRSWAARMEDAVELAELRGEPLSVAVLDLDGLKKVNDREGHAAGDDLLRAVASRWSAELGTHDVLARLGGDEFALALPGRSAPAAAQTVDRLRRATVDLGRCSAGVAQLERGEHRSALLGRADEALYAAKRQGGDATVAAPGTGGPVTGPVTAG